MCSSPGLSAFDTQAAIEKSRKLPLRADVFSLPITCVNCRFVNHAAYQFCTNCGFPVYPNTDNLAQYQLRLNRRTATKLMCTARILMARNALYVMAAILMVGFFYVLSDSKSSVIKGLVMVFMGIIYAGLGRWSIHKPFTSLLLGLMILLTFTAINTWAELSGGHPGFYLYYSLFIQAIFITIIWKGVKAAFQSDMLEEESKI